MFAQHLSHDCTLEQAHGYHGVWFSAGVQLKVHEPTLKLMQEYYAKSGKEVNAARLRMATLPQGAEVSLQLLHCLILQHQLCCF